MTVRPHATVGELRDLLDKWPADHVVRVEDRFGVALGDHLVECYDMQNPDNPEGAEGSRVLVLSFERADGEATAVVNEESDADAFAGLRR